MKCDDCGRLVCVIMLGLHVAQFATYQGVPGADDAAVTLAAPDNIANLRGIEAPSRFDSEGPQQTGERIDQAATSTVDGRDVRYVGGAAYTSAVGYGRAAPAEGRFDSEGPQREGEARAGAASSGAGGGGGGQTVRIGQAAEHDEALPLRPTELGAATEVGSALPIVPGSTGLRAA